MTINKSFTQCPVCGSESRFFETLTKELKEKGFARQDFEFYYNATKGAVTDPVKEKSIPIGSEVPGYILATDVCLDCGCVYAVKLEYFPARKVLTHIQPPPNLPKGFGFNDPRYS